MGVLRVFAGIPGFLDYATGVVAAYITSALTCHTGGWGRFRALPGRVVPEGDVEEFVGVNVGNGVVHRGGGDGGQDEAP